MSTGNMIITERDHSRFMSILDELDETANAKFVFLLDKSGQQIASAGDLESIDATALASLTAGNVAATEGVAQLVGESGFTNLFHEGRSDNLHISVVSDRVILLVVFDERSSLGLVRLRVEQCLAKLGLVVDEVVARADAPLRQQAQEAAALGDITEADLDALFGK